MNKSIGTVESNHPSFGDFLCDQRNLGRQATGGGCQERQILVLNAEDFRGGQGVLLNPEYSCLGCEGPPTLSKPHLSTFNSFVLFPPCYHF